MDLENIPHKISYRKIRYPRIEFTTGELHFVLPLNARPEGLFDKHERWIHKKRAFIAECLKESRKREVVRRSDGEFKGVVLSLMMKAADELNVKLNNVIFRFMRTKWASLSVNKNIIINKLGRQLPERLLEYIIFHELAHLKQKRHNDHYWEIVGKKFPEYEALEKELFIYWFRVRSEDKQLG
jgi:predicted metal-dependent hydrolase